MGTHAVSVSLYPNLAYKPDVDFEPIGIVVELPELIMARKDFPPNNLKEFVAYVKANAKKLNMAHAGEVIFAADGEPAEHVRRGRLCRRIDRVRWSDWR
jgi:Tripartite tricarboxylate transporter family receptor